jgi:hypothetical protein
MTPKGYDDHEAHVQAGVLFFYKGLGIYEGPTKRFCDPVRFKADNSCWIPEFPKKPIEFCWSNHSRSSPPGVHFFFLPETLLFAWTSLDTRWINGLAVIQLVFAAHLVFFLFFTFFLNHAPLQNRREWRCFACFFALPMIYMELIHWALEGFYDVAMVGLVLLSVYYLMKRRDAVRAIFYYSLAVFLHLRALWFCPIAILAAFDWARAWRESHRRGFSNPERLMLLSSVFTLGLTALVCVKLAPSLKLWELTNPVHISKIMKYDYYFYDFKFASLLLIAAAFFLKNRILAVCLITQLFFVVTGNHAMPWHSVSILPLFVIALFEEKTSVLTVTIALFWYLLQTYRVYGWNPLGAQALITVMSTLELRLLPLFYRG